MKITNEPITLTGRIRLKSLIVIRQEMPFKENLFSLVRGKWQLPESQGPIITRPEVMHDLESIMQAQTANSNSTPVLRLCGERGVGKTYVAMQFAHTHYENSHFQSIVWLNISDNNLDSLESQWVYLCVGLGLELTEDMQLADMIRLAYEKIISHGNALVIFDGVENYGSIEPYLKFNNTAITLLITSRNGITWGYTDRRYELKPFSEEQAIIWLDQWAEQHNQPSDRERNRKLALSVHCHPLRLRELVTLQGAVSAITPSVKLQSNVDIHAIEQDEFAFRFLRYCALMCPYEEIELDFFYALFGDEPNFEAFEVNEAIYLLKQHGMIGYPPKSNHFYTPSILSHIALRDVNKNDKIKMITELLQVCLKTLLPKNAPSIIMHLSHLVELFIEMLEPANNKQPTRLIFLQDTKPAQLLQVLKNPPPPFIKFIDLYNQILSKNNLDAIEDIRNAITNIRDFFQQKPSLGNKYSL